ncbi:hypothetical protein G5V57_06460 [Nordella sp. HKS 07]|uniref:hypothetical protein n=1 Tax=Nordella sp. HKS 07 TaxID=2712222 RepID=UPI0013E12B9D|nr:hypothetical protein [Nordella sp. HKS 07]QIG47408.1 hypothetical protein G5V57_06460 [Nordella sp. HKS 07]
MPETQFLAPHNHSTFSFRAAGDVYEPDHDLNVPPVTKWIRNGCFFVFVSRADPAVHFHEPQSGKRWSIPLPPRSHPFDLVVWRNWLFIAAGGKRLLATAEWEPATTWISLPCDKDIDALAIHQDTLLALDNIVQPKWLLRYELTSAGAQTPSRIMLPVHGTYEQIEAAAYCDGKFAVLSRTVNFGNVGKHVWILNCSTFEELGHACSFEAWLYPQFDSGFPPLVCARDIAACCDAVVIAGDRYGLMLTRLSSEPSENHRGILNDSFRQIWPNPAKRCPIVRVQACEEPAGFIVTSIARIQGQRGTPWEVAVSRRQTSAASSFLSYEQANNLLNSLPPGTMYGTPWRDRSMRAEMRREAGKKNRV